MGAHNIEFILEWMPQDKLLEWFQEESSSATREYGTNPYNGTISTIHDLQIHAGKVFPDTSSATIYALERAIKRQAIAVPVLSKKPQLNPRETAQIERLKAELQERQALGGPGMALLEAPQRIRGEALAAVMAGKSRFRACPECESKIAVSHIKTVACPVCRSESLVITPTVAKALSAAEKKRSQFDAKTGEIKQKIEAIREAAASTEERHWVVAGLAAS